MSHSHEHHTHGDHTLADSVAEANRKYFDQDDALAKFDRPEAHKMGQGIGQAMLDAYNFDKDSTTVLDFACGTGLISQQLISRSKRILGADISQVMVNQYNAYAKDHGIPPEQLAAVCTELKGNEDELEGTKFDVIVCSMAFHHFASPAEMTKILASFLKPGGMMMIADIMKAHGNSHLILEEQDRHAVPHQHGFSEDEMNTFFVGAGLSPGSYSKAMRAQWETHEMDLFLSTSVKAA